MSHTGASSQGNEFSFDKKLYNISKHFFEMVCEKMCNIGLAFVFLAKVAVRDFSWSCILFQMSKLRFECHYFLNACSWSYYEWFICSVIFN